MLSVIACFGIIYGIFRSRKAPQDPEAAPIVDSAHKLEIGEEIPYNELEFDKVPLKKCSMSSTICIRAAIWSLVEEKLWVPIF